MKTRFLRPVMLFLAAALLMLGATSCRTFQGFGRDVSHAGGHIERAAR